MRFRVLGPFEVAGEGGDPLPIAGSKERTILAYLIARAGSVVSVDDLADELWGDVPPRTAEKTVGSHISRLRRILEPDRPPGAASEVITTRGGGYLLETDGHEIDAIRFQRLAEEGRRSLVAGRPADASSALEEGLGLWRGAAYQGLRYTGFGASEGERLEELRRSAVEDRVDAKLTEGDAASSIADLEGMVREEPIRERRWTLLMLALYRAGRQGEALQAFARARTVLVEELGIEPGPDLQRLQAQILAQDPALERRRPSASRHVAPTDVCPYKGLSRFDTSDAEFFFGREQLVAEAVGRLVTGRFLAFVGASGSGKSSLMRAGLMHNLEAGAIPGSERWTYDLIRPGDHPVEVLDQALAVAVRKPPRLVLGIDQFEETFTACTDDAERTAFIDAVTAAASRREGAVTVVLAIRADHYGRCAEHRSFASLLAMNQILVGPMSEEELRRAVELPAERAGLRVDEQLTGALVADTVGRPGGLPLLSTALLELWMRRQHRTLTADQHLPGGGVHRAVARLGEEAFGRLDADGQAAARRILLRLAESEGGRVVPLRRPLVEFDLDRDPDASRALAVLADSRLLTLSDETVEVAHEALLREWPRLRTWLEDDAEGRRLHRHVSQSARVWDEGGRDDADLYRGSRLAAALEWAEAHDADSNNVEREFLGRSRSASEGDTARTRRTNRLLRTLLAGVAALLVVSLIVGGLALAQRDEARAAAAIADARQLAARSLVEEDLVVSLLLAREALALYDAPETRSALLASLQREPAAIAVMHPASFVTGDQTQWIELSPDGRTLAVGGAQPLVDLFDARTYQRIDDIQVGADTVAGAFSPDGSTLAVATADRRLVTVDVEGRTELTSVHSEGTDVDAVLYPSDGDVLLSAETFDGDGVLVPRDPVTLEPTAAPLHAHDWPIQAMAVSADGRRLVTMSTDPTASSVSGVDSGETVLRDARTLRPLNRPFPVAGIDVAVNPERPVAALVQNEGVLGHVEGHLVMLDLRTGNMRTSPGGHSGPLEDLGEGTGVAFSPDGRSVITIGNDGKMLVWDPSSLHVRASFQDPADLPIRGLTLASGGATAFTTDVDENVVSWDLAGDRRVGRPFTAGSGAENDWPFFSMSPDGRILAITQGTWLPHAEDTCPPRCLRGSVALVDAASLEPVGHIPIRPSLFTVATSFSPDGRTIAIVDGSNEVQLWSVDTLRPAGSPLVGASDLHFWTAAFSPDGVTLATAGYESPSGRGRAVVWDIAGRTPITETPKQDEWVNAVTFSPDSSLLVVSTGNSGGGDALVWNVGDRRTETLIHADDTGIFSSDISNDGSMLATGGESSSVQLWDLETGEPTGPAFNGLVGKPNTVDISPDGRTIVAASQAGELLTWDTATGMILGRTFPGPGADHTIAAAFTPDGRRLIVVSATGAAWAWDMDPASWQARACRIAGRSLTQAEWERYLPDRPYHATCGS